MINLCGGPDALRDSEFTLCSCALEGVALRKRPRREKPCMSSVLTELDVDGNWIYVAARLFCSGVELGKWTAWILVVFGWASLWDESQRIDRRPNRKSNKQKSKPYVEEESDKGRCRVVVKGVARRRTNQDKGVYEKDVRTQVR